MIDFLTQIRPLLESLFFIGGVVLAAAATYSLKQIRLMKKDMDTRNLRAAREKALEIAGAYDSSFLYLYKTYQEQCAKDEVPATYGGPVGDFTMESVPANHQAVADSHVKVAMRYNPLNQLELVAATILCGVADEKLAFDLMGPDYCASTEGLYDIIVRSRSRRPANSEMLIELYRVWKPRISKEELAIAKREIEEKMRELPERHISAIGEK